MCFCEEMFEAQRAEPLNILEVGVFHGGTLLYIRPALRTSPFRRHLHQLTAARILPAACARHHRTVALTQSSQIRCLNCRSALKILASR